jgi:hypothetical protein
MRIDENPRARTMDQVQAAIKMNSAARVLRQHKAAEDHIKMNSAARVPRQHKAAEDHIKRRRQAQLLTGYGAICLRRVRDRVVVEIEAETGAWIEVISEPFDSNFSHVIESIGILEAIREAGIDPEAP